VNNLTAEQFYKLMIAKQNLKVRCPKCDCNVWLIRNQDYGVCKVCGIKRFNKRGYFKDQIMRRLKCKI
jgi:hypothetical protein